MTTIQPTILQPMVRPNGLRQSSTHKWRRRRTVGFVNTGVCRGCQYPAVSTASICLHCGTRNPVTIGRAGMAVSLFAGALVFAVILVVLFVVL